jgi:hypothetical protein
LSSSGWWEGSGWNLVVDVWGNVIVWGLVPSCVGGPGGEDVGSGGEGAKGELSPMGHRIKVGLSCY